MAVKEPAVPRVIAKFAEEGIYAAIYAGCFVDRQIVLLTSIYIYVYCTETRAIVKRSKLDFRNFNKVTGYKRDYVDWEGDICAIGGCVYANVNVHVGSVDSPWIASISMDNGLVSAFYKGFKVAWPQAIDNSLLLRRETLNDEGIELKKLDMTGNLSHFVIIPGNSFDSVCVQQHRKRVIVGKGSQVSSYSLTDDGFGLIWKKNLLEFEEFGGGIFEIAAHPSGNIYISSSSELYRIGSDGEDFRAICEYDSMFSIMCDISDNALYFTCNDRLLRLEVPEKMHTELDTKAWRQILANPELHEQVTFEVEGKCINAMKSVLSKRSEYFQMMFNGNWSEAKHNRIVIKDTKYEAFLEVITFLYSQNLEVQEEFASEILRLTDMYQIHALKKVYENYFMTILTKGNVCDMFALAQRTSSSELSKSCVSLTKENALDVFESVSEKGLLCLMEAVQKSSKSSSS